MQKLTTYLNLALFTGLGASTAANAYIAVPPSLFQDNNNTFYVSLGGGLAWQDTGNWSGSSYNAAPNDPNDDKSRVGIGTAAIGYGFKNYPFRVELAYNFVGIGKSDWNDLTPAIYPPPGKTQSAKAEIFSNLGLVNLYGDLPITENWIPFLKIGAGYGLNDTKFTYTNQDGSSFESEGHGNNNFVWNVGAGINYVFTESVSIGAEVTYLHLGKAYAKAIIPANIDPSGTDYNRSYAKLDELTAYAATLNIAYHF